MNVHVNKLAFQTGSGQTQVFVLCNTFRIRVFDIINNYLIVSLRICGIKKNIGNPPQKIVISTDIWIKKEYIVNCNDF